jgi:hypothetical protein
MTTTGKNRIMIFGPKDDGTYVVEFRTAGGVPGPEAGSPYTERRPPLNLQRPRRSARHRSAFSPS